MTAGVQEKKKDLGLTLVAVRQEESRTSQVSAIKPVDTDVWV